MSLSRAMALVFGLPVLGFFVLSFSMIGVTVDAASQDRVGGAADVAVHVPPHYKPTNLNGQTFEGTCDSTGLAGGADGKRGYEKLAPLPPPPTKDHSAVTSVPE
jgi:hypothetical protein